LGEEFFSPITTQPLNNTFLIHKNQALYDQLGLDFDEKTLLKIASGEQKFEGTQPIASIYAGHQFGHFVPQLGDGRSCLIGQVSGYELSLKGAEQLRIHVAQMVVRYFDPLFVSIYAQLR